MPFPPVPTPSSNVTIDAETSRFGMALALLIATFLSAFLKLPDWVIASLATGTASATTYYFVSRLRQAGQTIVYYVTERA
jgi:hypothetical protein